jgi:CarboxypepD_reg-like domain
MLKRLFLVILAPVLVLLSSRQSSAQAPTPVKHTQLIQLSGVIVDRDSVQPVPFVAILIKRSVGGTIADANGYFSLIVVPGDTLLFQALGYKSNSYIVSDTLSTDKYSLIHLMTRDTSNLKPFVVYSWPSKEAFKSAFLKLDLPDNDLVRAKKNMVIAARKARYSDSRSPGTNYLQTVQQENDKLYYAGQYPPNNLLNPLAWAKFLQAWKDGTLNIQ